MEEEPTQPSTQHVLDPRRLGRNNSGLSESDISDVLCILHPASLAAYHIVSDTASYKPQHILQNEGLVSYDEYGANIDEQETIILDGKAMCTAGNDLALRMSSNTVSPQLGFAFGRNPQMCDVVILRDSAKRISNVHFRIYVNQNGVLMLMDVSTNGTLVDDVLLKSKDPTFPSTRMINPGSIIQILSAVEDEKVKFIVRLPSREGHEDEYQRKFAAYMIHCAVAKDRGQGRGAQGNHHRRVAGAPGTLAGGRGMASVVPNAYSNPYGMQWNGGNKYNVVGMLGKGAFATVYQLATALDGEPLAAKELEKRRFMKNGQLDQRLDNEMRIMKELRHPNIVQYIDYHDVDRYLYIIMEYVPCGDLQGYLSKGNLPEHAAKRMARQILSCLAYLHKKKITHRDIKPDNILIACEDPFTVKLSDFGLSKVVKNNETFLKTFCGTLLYCAPEVFPHYDAHIAAQGTKRRRGTAQKSSFHSYSQSVDVWSFAAVLWFALCGSPPFEGVSDPTGKGMFNKIMETSLDVTPLKRVNVSDDCIDLLLKMLNIDPTSRPTEQQCLRHKWLYDGTEVADETPLNAIAEEEEEDVAEEAEEQLSQLSIHEKSSGSNVPSDEEEEVDLAAEDFEFLLDNNPSKRVKTDQLFPRNQPRDRDDFDSSLEVSYHSAAGHIGEIPEDSFLPIPQPAGRPRLFGEIGQSALQSSGILGAQANVALSIHTSDDEAPHPGNHQSAILRNGAEPASSPSADRIIAQMDGVLSSPSLLGTESLVRELNMTSPQSPNSAAATPNEPSTPKTPEVEQHSSLGLGDSMSSEPTPKAPPFNRQINLPKTASFYYDPYDPTTHNLEYASKASGHDFVAEAASKNALHSIPDTIHFSASSSENGSTHADVSANSTPVTVSMPAEFLRPPPRLGKLTATPDSFSPIVLKLDQNNTSWGRLLENTIVYPHVNDTRIPKKAFTIWFHAEGHDFKALEEQGRDWTKLDGLYTGINTFTRNGIHVNGVHLREKDDKGRILYGRLHSGDMITVFLDRKESTCLKFVCEFYHGAAREKRAPGTRFEVKKGS
ncbi:meiosis-specific serine/threonine-protein kinase mek1 [Glonium stellatum]|uniref:Autophagy-related protein 1 n=1 Tax=Glonium stellatum TaxID=574774 RepID=A0A8E2JSR3_9PEZI|nr:meiosis-specific serine/threonine-protein kinase mek1 [Glonium stellatum]